MFRYVFKTLLWNAVAVASTGNAVSASLSLRDGQILESVVLKASSVSGTADVKLEYITSHDDVNYEDYADTQDLTSSTATAKPNNVEGWNPYIMVDAPANAYIKFKVTGVAANPADTLVSAYAMLREQPTG